MKTITKTQFGMIKRVAMNVNPLVTKKNKNLAKIDALLAENELLKSQIEGHEGGVKALTGYQSEDLVKKVVVKIDKYDENGKQLTMTKYVPTDMVVYDEDSKSYHIAETIEDAEIVSALPITEMGNDFDEDTEKIKSESNVEA